MRDAVPIVFVVDDDVLVRESLELLIQSAGCRAETFASAEEFLARPRVLSPSCLVLDVTLPHLNGLDLQERIAADRVDMPIIFITGDADIPTIVRAMKAGAAEFLTKPFDADVLLNAIREAVDRSEYVLRQEAKMRSLHNRYASLTAREREVLDLVVTGELNKQVGGDLGISEITVKAHRGHMMRKMKAGSLVDLVPRGSMRQYKHSSWKQPRPHGVGFVPGALLRMITFVPLVLAPVMANAADVRIDGADSPSSKQESSVQADAKDKDVIRDETKKHGVKSGDTESPLEEIVVTGTYIRGVAPASPVITITSVDIENSGASTAGEVLRELPESFAGGQQSTIGTNGAGPYQNLSNFNYSDSANLRGFASDSTLVLINGHRAPVTGLQDSVDISAVPLPAIDRVEVVTDGASALYGSDAVGGVVNFILKKDYSGAESRAEFGIPTESGGFTQRYGQLFGTTWEGGSALISYQYRDQDGLYGSQRNWYTGPNPMSLLGSIHQNSAFLDVSQQVDSNLSIFAQGLYNRTTSLGISTDPSSPTVYLPTVGYTYNATVGANLILAHDWKVDFTGTIGADRFDHLESEPCCNYAADIVPTNRLSIGEALGEGPVISLPSGDVRAAVGGGYRGERIVSEALAPVIASRNIEYGFGEITLPLIGAQTAQRGAQELLLTLAGRY